MLTKYNIVSRVGRNRKYTFVLHLINSIKSCENTSNLETILSNDNNILILKKMKVVVSINLMK